MNLHFLRFLAQPAFVIPWYAFGAIGAVLVLRDTFTANRQVTPALKAAWPIIVLFFSVIGVVLYLGSCRPKHIGSIWNEAGAEDANRTHREFVAEKWKKVVGSDIHCVAGDGLGIVTAMISCDCSGSDSGRRFGQSTSSGSLLAGSCFRPPRCITWVCPGGRRSGRAAEPSSSQWRP